MFLLHYKIDSSEIMEAPNIKESIVLFSEGFPWV